MQCEDVNGGITKPILKFMVEAPGMLAQDNATLATLFLHKSFGISYKLETQFSFILAKALLIETLCMIQEKT